MPSKGKNAHSGQNQGSARKKQNRLRKWTINFQSKKRALNTAQDLQDAVECEIVIRDIEQITGSRDWKSAFSDTVRIRPGLEKYFGGSVINTLDYLQFEANLDGTSFEREALSRLIALGYQLEEIEVEFGFDDKREKWGRCVWYKDHPSYHDTKKLEEMKPFLHIIAPLGLNFLISWFKTENCGDQEFTLTSTQFAPHFVFHKTIIFRKVVLSLPPQNYAKAA